MLPSPEYGGISSEKISEITGKNLGETRNRTQWELAYHDPESAETAGINEAE